FADGTSGYLRRLFPGKSIDSGRDCRKGDGPCLIFASKLHAAAVAASQQIGFAMRAAAPDRPNGVEDPLCGKIEPRGGLCRAGGAAPQLLAGPKEVFAGGPVNCAIDAASAEQGGVCRVDDGIDFELCDVSANHFETSHLGPPD